MGERVLLNWLASALLLLSLPSLAKAQEETPDQAPDRVPDQTWADPAFLVIAHRGASGERPEHTLAAYERAIDQGAHYIEPDLTVTKDNVLIARHEPDLSETTDIGTRTEFADHPRTKTVDGTLITGWFAEDLTLAEIRTLRAKERIPAIRPANARFDGLYPVPTFDEIVQLVRAKEAETGRPIGLYPEIKHPTYLLEQGFDIVDLLVAALRRRDLANADARMFVQSFEIAPLRRLNGMVDVRLVQLIADEGGPADAPDLLYADMATPAGLAEIATYADWIGAAIPVLFGPAGTGLPPIADAKAAGLLVHAWTARKENAFLPEQLRGSGGPAQTGCDYSLYATLMSAGIDGVFADNPARVLTIDPQSNPVCMGGG